MTDLGERQPRRRRRWWRRSALPRSRSALALGAMVAVALLALLLVGLTRARPGKDIPFYDPESTTTTTAAPVVFPSMTVGATVPRLPAPTTTRPATTTTRRP